MQDSNKNNCTNELFGKWRSKPQSGGSYIDITDECFIHYNSTSAYSFPDKDTLHYEILYKRVSGDPYTLIGAWQDEVTGDKIAFFEDGTLVSSSFDGEVWTATFTATKTHITSRELRFRIETDGLNITWIQVVDNSEKNGTFEIVSPDKWILKLEGEKERTYYRE